MGGENTGCTEETTNVFSRSLCSTRSARPQRLQPHRIGCTLPFRTRSRSRIRLLGCRGCDTIGPRVLWRRSLELTVAGRCRNGPALFRCARKDLRACGVDVAIDEESRYSDAPWVRAKSRKRRYLHNTVTVRRRRDRVPSRRRSIKGQRLRRNRRAVGANNIAAGPSNQYHAAPRRVRERTLAQRGMMEAVTWSFILVLMSISMAA